MLVFLTSSLRLKLAAPEVVGVGKRLQRCFQPPEHKSPRWVRSDNEIENDVDATLPRS